MPRCHLCSKETENVKIVFKTYDEQLYFCHLWHLWKWLKARLSDDVRTLEEKNG